jgi:hypothetical protein
MALTEIKADPPRLPLTLMCSDIGSQQAHYERLFAPVSRPARSGRPDGLQANERSLRCLTDPANSGILSQPDVGAGTSQRLPPGL